MRRIVLTIAAILAIVTQSASANTSSDAVTRGWFSLSDNAGIMMMETDFGSTRHARTAYTSFSDQEVENTFDPINEPEFAHMPDDASQDIAADNAKTWVFMAVFADDIMLHYVTVYTVDSRLIVAIAVTEDYDIIDDYVDAMRDTSTDGLSRITLPRSYVELDF